MTQALVDQDSQADRLAEQGGRDMFVQLTGLDTDDRPFEVFINTALVDIVRPAKSGTFIGLVGPLGESSIHVREQIDEVMALLQGAEVRHDQD